MTNNIDQNNAVQQMAAPGGWNDPDMLEVGNTGLTPDENIAHFSLWALTKAPLLLGNDVTQVTPEIYNIIANKEVIAVNQDPLGVQGSVVKRIPANSSTTFGNIIYAANCQRLPAQEFTYNATSGNLQSVLTGECIAQFIPWWACDYDPYVGAPLYLEPCNVNCKGQMQKWAMIGNSMQTRFNADAPLCAQIGGPTHSDIYLWNCNAANNQTWTFGSGNIYNVEGRCMTVSAGPEVWAAPLSNNSVAVVLFNRANTTQEVTLDFDDIMVNRPVTIRDLWAHEDKGIFTSSFSTSDGGEAPAETV